MKISVAMTVYNGEKYLEEQLDSIRLQTKKVDEVVICDDISSDHSVEYIEKYIKKYELQNQWRLYVNPTNLGYATNFFEAVKKTSGEYIFFCDQDDIWVEDRVEKMIQLMEDNPQIQMLGSEFEPFSCTEDAPTISSEVLKRFSNDNSLEKIELNKKTVFIGSEGCTMCIRRSFFDKIQGYWFPRWAHDEMVWKLALCMDGCYIYHRTTLLRRMHSENVSKRKMRDIKKRTQFLKDLQQSHEQTLKFASDTNMPSKVERLLARNSKATELRIEILEEKKVWNTVLLALGYIDCYHSKKSIPVELWMALKDKR